MGSLSLKQRLIRAIKKGYRPPSYVLTEYEMIEDEIESTALGMLRTNTEESILKEIKDYV